jgi:hypothetical protein
MTAILKVDTIQDTSGNNIINESSDTITIGASGDTISIPSGATIANSGTATGFGANTPAFEAYTTGLQSITENAYVKMTFGTEVFDTAGNYASDRFTPQTAGKYFVYAKGTADPSNYENGRTAILKIYKNGSALEYTKYDTMTGGNSSADGFTAATPSARAVVDMNGSSDYLEAYFLLNTWSDSGAQVGSKQFGAYRIIT